MDRITDAYNGVGFSKEFMEKTRDRLHWICDQVTGGLVLDIGCSQGMCSILLGRLGYRVLGIDINEEAVAFARNSLSKEPQSVQDMLEFRCGDFAHYPDDGRRFDAVIFGEVLEHLVEPGIFIQKAFALLKSGGRVVVTVPFGINDDPDHRQTFYYAEINRLLFPFFKVLDVRFFGPWIGFVAERREETVPFVDNVDYSVLERVERAVFAQERVLRDNLASRKKMIDGLSASKTSLAVEVERQQKWNTSLEAQNASMTAAMERQQEAVRGLEAKRSALEAANARQEETIVAMKSENARQEETIVDMKSENARQQETIVDMKSENARQQETIVAMKSENAALMAEKECLQGSNATLTEGQRCLQEANAALAAENERLQKTIAALEAEKAQQETVIDDLKKAKAKTSVEIVRQKKSVVNLTTWKRNAVSQIARMKAQLADEGGLVRELDAKYRKLSNAKLGRFTLAYWKFKDDIKIRLLRPKKKVVRGADKTPYADILQAAKSLPTSNGGRFYTKAHCRIGLVCDRFYYDSVKSAAEFVYLTPDGWREVLPGIDMLLLVSTWNGLNGTEWQGAATVGSKRREIILEMAEAGRNRGIPVVFYSKEDPPHYHDFLEIARHCDWVFTTCAEKVDDYRRDCGHDRVAVMRFGIDPTFHNPIGCCQKRSRGVLFSGSWYRKFPERCQDLENIFDGVLASSRRLEIVDRFSAVKTTDGRFDFPVKFKKRVHAALDHDVLQNLHKLFDWSININTVKNSATMFANRAYELQAAGTLLVSNYSMGVNGLLPLVNIVYQPSDVIELLRSLDDEALYARQMASVRQVMTGETCYDRVSQMLENVGIRGCGLSRKVLVVANKLTDDIKRMFDAQTFPDRAICSESDFTQSRFDEADVVAFWRAGSDYGPFYLEDMVNAFKYTACDYVTKCAFLKKGKVVPGVEHDYVATMPDKCRTVFWRAAFDYAFLKKIDGRLDLPNGYAVDHLNYDARPTRMDWSGIFQGRDKPEISVVVPVYNNGVRLLGKAFASLVKSRLFPKMEILIVDDGSSDAATLGIIEQLRVANPNVRTWCFPRGGSGSASRPRNRGVELARGQYVLFLDPDDEIISVGVETLLSTAREHGADLVVGDYKIIGETVIGGGCSAEVFKWHPDGIVNKQGRKLLEELNYQAIRLHSMLIRRQLMLDNGMRQIEGAIGEDTLFSNMLLEKSDKTVFVGVPVQIYYNSIAGSVVNDVSPSFFDRYLATADGWVEWLKRIDVYEQFMSVRFPHYVVVWLFRKLIQAPCAKRVECARHLYAVLTRYPGVETVKHDAVHAFVQAGAQGDFAEAVAVAERAIAR